MNLGRFSLSVLAAVSILATVVVVLALFQDAGAGTLWLITILGTYIPAILVVRDILTSDRLPKESRVRWSLFVLCTGAVGITAYAVRSMSVRAI